MRAIDLVEAQREELRKAAESLDCWLHVYASDMCDYAKVKQSRAIIREAGGTIAFIAQRSASIRAILSETVDGWQPIETVPHDKTVMLANFKNMCLLTGAPHVWTATYVTKWENGRGEVVEEEPMWCECSFAATNENGEPTHWMNLPPEPIAVDK